MLQYDPKRTEKIVERLRSAEGVFRLMSVVSGMLLFGGVGATVGRPYGTDALVTGCLIGAAGGFAMGHYSTVLVSASVEWMCQMLIAVGANVGKSPDRSNES